MEWRCDNVRDCIDGSDEENCNAECAEGNSNCTSKSDVDQLDKSHVKGNCTGDHFKCNQSTSECIEESMVCDGKKDCSNGADEDKNCHINECKDKTHFCSQKCIDLKDGYKCACYEGFSLHKNGFTCQGINLLFFFYISVCFAFEVTLFYKFSTRQK